MADMRAGVRRLIHERVSSVAQSDPDRLAVCDHTGPLDYGMLEARSNALARRLNALGVGPGVRVGLCHERSAVSVIGALAVLKAGGAYVGFDPVYPEIRLTYMLNDAAVAVLLTDRSTADRLGPVDAVVIDLDRETEAAEPAPAGAIPAPVAGPAPGVDDVAYVIYTSGSSGVPKGVEVSHGNLLHLVDWHCEAFDLTAADRASMLASPAFDASVWEMWPALGVGASLHVADAKTVAVPDRLRNWLVATGITVSFVPTPLAEGLLDLAWPAGGALRLMLTGGDVLHRRPAAGSPFAVVNNYGVAEATVVSTSGVVPEESGQRGIPSIGEPIRGTRLHVLDGDGRPVADGEVGELYIGGAGVALGYLGRAELTADRFRPDPFAPEPGARMYRTGDLVRRALDRQYEFVGRVDNQVQVRGQRVELDEIAAALTAHPTVRASIVVAQENGPGDLVLVAYVVPVSGPTLDRDTLREHLSSRLPQYMVPTAFVTRESLPLTSNGKVDRAALSTGVVPSDRAGVRDQGREEPGASVAGASPLAVAVVAILRELLELDRVGLHDNFFELGGHSLLAAQLAARLEDRFDVEVSLLDVFDNPTAAGIATVIEGDVGVVAEQGSRTDAAR